jgi:MSHA pilin protein MshC
MATRTLPSARRAGARGFSARGFTLIELIMVITVLGILSFVAAARMVDRADIDAHGYTEQLASTLRFAHKAAVAQRRYVYVNIDTAARRIRVCLDATIACNQPLAAPAGGVLDLTAPAGIALTSGASQFSFDGLGRPSLAANLELQASVGGQTYTVVVERESGYVRRG